MLRRVNIDLSPEEIEFRQEFRAWLTRNIPEGWDPSQAIRPILGTVAVPSFVTLDPSADQAYADLHDNALARNWSTPDGLHVFGRVPSDQWVQGLKTTLAANNIRGNVYGIDTERDKALGLFTIAPREAGQMMKHLA